MNGLRSDISLNLYLLQDGDSTAAAGSLAKLLLAQCDEVRLRSRSTIRVTMAQLARDLNVSHVGAGMENWKEVGTRDG